MLEGSTLCIHADIYRYRYTYTFSLVNLHPAQKEGRDFWCCLCFCECSCLSVISGASQVYKPVGIDVCISVCTHIYIYCTLVLCVCGYWEYMLTFTTVWTCGHGAGAPHLSQAVESSLKKLLRRSNEHCLHY